jgi:hypothetical protein
MIDRSSAPSISTRGGTPVPAAAPPGWVPDRDPVPAVAPPGWVSDRDRSDLTRTILKRIVDLYKARCGERFLLESPSRNPEYPDLKILELEPQSRFPGAKRAFQGLRGTVVMEPSPATDFEGRSWRDFEVSAVAYVWQHIEVSNNRVRMPKLHAEAIVRLRSLDGGIGENWYKHSDVNMKFGTPEVRWAVYNHCIKTGQHTPLAPINPGRRQARPYDYLPLSQ